MDFDRIGGQVEKVGQAEKVGQVEEDGQGN